MIRWRVALFGVVSFAGYPAAHAAQSSRSLALLSPPPWLARSTAIALSPWGIQVVSSDAAAPGSDAASALRGARAIVAERHVDAVAWLVETRDARTLLIYDREADELVSREVPVGDVDEANADALALSIKAILRSSVAASRGGPFGSARRGAPVLASPSPWGHLRLEGDLGFRGLASAPRADARFGLGLGWWPAHFGQRAGLALRIEEGTGLRVQSHELTARLDDHAIALSVRTRASLASRLTIEPAMGFALHWTLLDGATIDGHALGGLSFVDPAIEGSVLVGYAFGDSLMLGIRSGGSYWIRTQDYVVDDPPGFSVGRWQGTFAVVVCARLN